MAKIPSFRHLSDADLTKEGPRLLHNERHATATVVAWLMEFDLRRLYLPLGYSSLFIYCRQGLHMSESATYRRIEAARAASRFPCILELLGDGRISLTTVSVLSRHLSADNHESLLAEATHRSTREVEVIAARLAPKPDVPSIVRKLPPQVSEVDKPGTRPLHSQLASKATATLASYASEAPTTKSVPLPTPRSVIAPLSPERFKLQVTISQEAHDDLRQLQDLMRHVIPNGDAARIVERALKVLLKEVLRRKCGIVDRPRRGDALQKLIDVPPVH